MKDSIKNRSFRDRGHTHQPTVTPSDLFDKDELVLKDMGRVDKNMKNLEKALKKVKKRLKKHMHLML